MVKKYADLFLDARRALLKQEGQFAANVARELVCAASGKTAEQVIADREIYASEEVCELTESFVQRRLRGEPMPYILGQWDFYGMTLTVTPDVLIPRMDTEVLVDAALRVLVGRKMNARILDLCSGSGCIGCALAHELPAARVVMVDISEEALAVSKENLRRNHQNRTICLKADALEKPPMGIGTFDLIVSNPPYVASMDILTLDSSVRDYEPIWALDGGEDGYRFYKAIIKYWKSLLRPGGFLLFEVGEGQAATVKDMLSSAGFRAVGSRLDTLNIERVVIGKM